MQNCFRKGDLVLPETGEVVQNEEKEDAPPPLGMDEEAWQEFVLLDDGLKTEYGADENTIIEEIQDKLNNADSNSEEQEPKEERTFLSRKEIVVATRTLERVFMKEGNTDLGHRMNVEVQKALMNNA